MPFTVSQTVNSKMIADLVVTAFEGGSAYWCASAELTTIPAYVPEPDQVGVVRYSHHQVYDGDFEFTVTTNDDEPETFKVGPAKFQTGLNLFATKFPERFANWQKEDYDAEDADVFWQLTVLGDVVYG